jgi:hypothetical protein
MAMMSIVIPIFGIFACAALITANLVNVASAQTLGEFALIIRLLTDANVKNQGQCIQTLPQLISSAGIMGDFTKQQIMDFAKIICKDRFKS